MSKIFVVVIFTASLGSYASTVIDRLDQKKYGYYKLYREHCRYIKQTNFYVKDLGKLGRDLKDVIFVDNIP